MNHIICVIDRSGSMGNMADEAIGGFNSFLEDQKKENDQDILTYVQFDHEYDVVCQRRPLHAVEPLTNQSFVPRGTTALLDAMGQTIANTRDWVKSDENVILLVLTDGHENASKEYDKVKVKDMVTHHQDKYGWKVIYVGPDVDAFDTGASLGIRREFIIPYHVSKEGTTEAYASASYTVSQSKS